MPSPETKTYSDAELIALVDERLRTFIADTVEPANLREAIEYALFGGGKRVRPVLCMRSCEAVGGKAEDAVNAAAAVELIHCFSLVHDDLPAMDDDDLRRGRPTLHKHTSEAMAILAGDAMTALAFTMLCSSQGKTPQCVQLNVQTLADCTSQMITGQVYDTMGGFDDDQDDIVKLKEIHRHKTAMLLIAAVSMGGRSGGTTIVQRVSLHAYADALGLMFQAVDDLLDVTQTAEQVGKATGKDAQAGKLTYPGLLGIEGTKKEIAELLEKALTALEPLGERAGPLRDMARRLAARQK